MALFFTSDPHFSHKNVMEYCGRPFKDITEMNSRLINAINETVGPEDTLYILGDFVWGNSQDAVDLVKRIACKNLYFIFGNHDFKAMTPLLNTPHFKKMSHYEEVRVKDSDAPRGEQLIVLSHYPMLSWNKGHHGSWMLHGHCHGNMVYPEVLKNKRILDVGVDCFNYKPVSYDEIKALFKHKESLGHHE